MPPLGAIILLLLALIAYARFLRPPPRRTSWGRRARYRTMFARTALLLGLPGLLVVAGAGRLDALFHFPPELYALQWRALTILGFDNATEFTTGLFVVGILSGGALGALAARVLGRRWPFTIGRIALILPRTRGELGWGALLSINAGVSEELFFRLAIPLLIAMAGAPPWTGMAFSLALFGWAHRWQGGTGAVASLALGGMLTAAYCASGQLWVAMLLHATIDLNALVLRPLIGGSLPKR